MPNTWESNASGHKVFSGDTFQPIRIAFTVIHLHEHIFDLPGELTFTKTNDLQKGNTIALFFP